MNNLGPKALPKPILSSSYETYLILSSENAEDRTYLLTMPGE